MTIERYRHRRTVGSGPPQDLPFGEIAYSDADGLLHVGRPNGQARSFAQPTDPSWEDITGVPATFPPSAHTHDYAATTHGHPWSQITDTPAAFPPSAHGHPWSQITDTPAAFPPITHGHPWSQITSVPTTFPPSAHSHAAIEIALTPINGFSPVVAGSNRLIVWPGLGLASVVFSVSRASIPAGGTAVLSWDATFTPTHPARDNVAGVQFSPAFALNMCHFVLNGASLLFYQLETGASNYALLDGEISFRYA